MGLKCAILGHSFEAADVERQREEQGSEVVTVVREIERCTRCGAERVVSENTEVTAVVDAEDVGLDTGDIGGGGAGGGGAGGGIGGAVERSGAADDADSRSDDEAAARRTADEAAAAVDELAESPDERSDETFAARDPEEEDAEILTDDDQEREPGQWPEEARGESWGDDASGTDDDADPDERDTGAVDLDEVTEPAPEIDDTEDESLAGITVPDGAIVCPECGFEVDPESSYRDGDPCPECNAWLTSERNP